jgi:uncharacterized membrane protein YkoI
MKKKIAFIMSGVVAVAILGFGVLYTSTSKAEAALSTEDVRKMVNKQYPGEITEIEQENEFNRVIYEVEVKGEEKKYDIKLDGKTGEVLNIIEKPMKDRAEVIKDKKNNTAQVEKDEVKKEVKHEEKSSESQTKVEGNSQPKEVVINEKKELAPDQKNQSTEKAIISLEEAKKIALGAFSGEIEDIELDKEDGRLIYEVEIERGDKEAKIEIDAYTGEVIIIEIDED